MNTAKRILAIRHIRGFSLVELMVVIAIIAILAAVSIPTIMRSTRRAASREAATEFANILRAARAQAMSRGEVVLVTVDPDGPQLVELRRYDLDLGQAGIQPARSCMQAQDLGQYTAPGNVVATLPLVRLDPNMSLILSRIGPVTVQPGDPPMQMCFSPDGSIQTPAGAPVRAGFIECPTLGAVFAMSRTPQASLDLTFSGATSIFCAFDGNNTGDRSTMQRNLSIDRDLNDVFIIEAAYNGSVQVYQ